MPMQWSESKWEVRKGINQIAALKAISINLL